MHFQIKWSSSKSDFFCHLRQNFRDIFLGFVEKSGSFLSGKICRRYRTTQVGALLFETKVRTGDKNWSQVWCPWAFSFGAIEMATSVFSRGHLFSGFEIFQKYLLGNLIFFAKKSTLGDMSSRAKKILYFGHACFINLVAQLLEFLVPIFAKKW